MDTLKGIALGLAAGVAGVLLGIALGQAASHLTATDEARAKLVAAPTVHAQPAAREHGAPTPRTRGRGEPDPKQGEALFAANCAPCHQPGGMGLPGLAPSIRNRDFLALASDEFITTTIQQGRPGTSMVQRPDLAGESTDHIIAYLRDLPVVRPVQVSVDPHKTRRGDAARGAATYAVYCASCHGQDGEGYSGGGAGPGIGLPGFLSAASDDYIYHTVRMGRVGTAMRSFIGAEGLADLQPSEVHDIIAFLRGPRDGTLGTEFETAAHQPEADPEEGRSLFAANCAPCHQPNGTGLPGLAPSIRNRDFLALASDEFIRSTIASGRAGTAMVPRPDLAGEKTDHLIAFLRDMEIAHPAQIAVDPQRKIDGNAHQGAELYGVYCASCHGAKGEGYGAGGSGPGIGLAGFLSVASDDYIFQTVKHGRIGTAMMGFMGSRGLANLDEQEIGDIVVHLRSLNP